MAQTQAHGACRNSAAWCLLVAGDASVETNAGPQKVFVGEFVQFPHNLQDGRASVVTLVHEGQSAFLGLFQRHFERHFSTPE
jgi:hypothetical protein